MVTLEKPIHRYIGIGLILVGAVVIVVAAVIAYTSFYSYRIHEFTDSSLEGVYYQTRIYTGDDNCTARIPRCNGLG